MKKVSLPFWSSPLSIFFTLIFLQPASFRAIAQTAISSASTSYVTTSMGKTYIATGVSTLAGNSYTYNYGNLSGTANNDLQLSSFIAGGINYTYYPVANAIIKFRRVDNASVSGIRNLKFTEGDSTSSQVINVAGSYDDDMESFFKSNKSFNSGTDNLFANLGDGNNNYNNIERLDVIFPNGTSSADNTKVGFAIFERGSTFGHDAVKAALILSIDSSNMPTSYSSIVSINSSNYGSSDVIPGKWYVIARKDNGVDSNLKASLTTNQPIGGVFFKYSDFGISNGTRVYGYSLLPNDFTGTPSDAINYSNAVFFPTNTDATGNGGGIDLVAVTGISQSSNVLAINSFNLKVQKINNNAWLQWSFTSQQNNKSFSIERSFDGINYINTASVSMSANFSSASQYQFTDDLSLVSAEQIYYRLKAINSDNSFIYSSVAVLKNIVNKNTFIKLYPLPLQAQSFINTEAGYYKIQLFNSNAALVKSWSNLYISPVTPLSIYDKSMARGNYYLQIINFATGNKQNVKLVVE